MEEHYLLVNVLPKIVSDTRSTAHVFYFHAPKAAFDADPEAAALLEGVQGLGMDGGGNSSAWNRKELAYFACKTRVNDIVWPPSPGETEETPDTGESPGEKLAHEKSAVWQNAGVEVCSLPPGVAVVRVITCNISKML